MHRFTRSILASMCVIATSAAVASAAHKSTPFQGAKANKGYVVHEDGEGRLKLVLSDDFVVPETPDPHWQIVDTAGNVYLLNRLKIKDDGYNKTLVLPAYIHDVAKVQIWCAWAETLLGEASFEPPAVAMAQSMRPMAKSTK